MLTCKIQRVPVRAKMASCLNVGLETAGGGFVMATGRVAAKIK
jgi:hypothetical protein